MTRGPILFALLALAACNTRQPSGQDMSDEEAIAAVEAAQNRLPPLAPIEPQALVRSDLDRIEAGPRCSFHPANAPGRDPVMISGPSLAHLKLDGELIKLASDPGGQSLPSGTWQHYVGKRVTMRIEWRGGEGEPLGAGLSSWPARLVLRDPIDRIAYSAEGALACGS